MTGPEFISEAGEEEREQGFWNSLVAEKLNELRTRESKVTAIWTAAS